MSTLADTQNQPDDRRLPIDRVGVKNLAYPIQVKDRDRERQSTVAHVSLAVDLPHHFKGTHMSRFVEVLHSHGDCLDVREMATIPRELLERLDAREAHVTFRFPFFRRKAAPVTGRIGMMDYNVTFDITANAEGLDFIVIVEVPVTTLCPCSKAISARGAHNQRGLVTCAIRFTEPVWIEDLIDVIEASASSQLYSLLKRPDEKFVTEAAYDKPVFVEDLVRNVAGALAIMPQITWFRVEAENYESIHNHNAYGVIESPQTPPD